MYMIETLLITLLVYLVTASFCGFIFLNKRYTYIIKKFNECIDLMCREYRHQASLAFEDVCGKYLLSSRERDVLKKLLTGMQIKEIAIDLNLSIHTVRNHTQRIYKKCKVQNRIELVNIFAASPSGVSPGKNK
jgi:DNA-binding NarL/FixJ family response regulator